MKRLLAALLLFAALAAPAQAHLNLPCFLCPKDPCLPKTTKHYPKPPKQCFKATKTDHPCLKCLHLCK